LVMLVCLVAIPLAALFGSSMPAVIKAVQQGRWPTLAELRGNANAQQSLLPAGPDFVPASAPQAAVAGPAAAGGEPNRPVAAGSAAQWPGPAAEPSGVLRAGYDAPLGPGQPATRGPTVGLMQLPANEPNLVPVGPGGERPAAASDMSPLARPLASGPAAANLRSSRGPDPYTQIQDRLQQLGATYYLLEFLGDQRVYRFYCRMAVGGNIRTPRPFWSLDADPCKAMSQVLQQVESWQSGRL
jgi:hypothetical protein